MVCADACPKSAITVNLGPDGHNYPSVNPDLCVNCRLCEKKCPVVSKYDYGINSFESKPFAGWSLNSEIRSNGATTGLFGTMALYAINNGWKVAGAVMDGLSCKYILTDNAGDISAIQGSKYTESNPAGIYKEIYKYVNAGGKVLFGGLPCHAAALLNFIPDKFRDSIIVVDLICGGVPSSHLISTFKDHSSCGCSEIVHFRTKKDSGWSPNGFRYNLAYKDNNGTEIHIEKGKRNLITDGFACGLTNRYSCYGCKFAFLHRKSDLTIGDLWGDERFPEQHAAGVSGLLIHSNRGRAFIESCDIELTPISFKELLKRNFRLFDGESLKKHFPERKYLTKAFKTFSYTTLLEIYCSDLRKKKLRCLLIAPWRMLSFRLDSRQHSNRKNRILKNL